MNAPYFELSHDLNEFFIEEMIEKVNEASNEDEIDDIERTVYDEIKDLDDEYLLRMFKDAVREKRILLKIDCLEEDDDFHNDEEI